MGLALACQQGSYLRGRCDGVASQRVVELWMGRLMARSLASHDDQWRVFGGAQRGRNRRYLLDALPGSSRQASKLRTHLFHDRQQSFQGNIRAKIDDTVAMANQRK